jgi:hypothetical protein
LNSLLKLRAILRENSRVFPLYVPRAKLPNHSLNRLQEYSQANHPTTPASALAS